MDLDKHNGNSDGKCFTSCGHLQRLLGRIVVNTDERNRYEGNDRDRNVYYSTWRPVWIIEADGTCCVRRSVYFDQVVCWSTKQGALSYQHGRFLSSWTLSWISDGFNHSWSVLTGRAVVTREESGRNLYVEALRGENIIYKCTDAFSAIPAFRVRRSGAVAWNWRWIGGLYGQETEECPQEQASETGSDATWARQPSQVSPQYAVLFGW